MVGALVNRCFARLIVGFTVGFTVGLTVGFTVGLIVGFTVGQKKRSSVETEAFVSTSREFYLKAL